MGVWMADESTVMMVSHGISRPNGAANEPAFFGGEISVPLSANKLMGASKTAGRAGAELVAGTIFLRQRILVRAFRVAD